MLKRIVFKVVSLTVSGAADGVDEAVPSRVHGGAGLGRGDEVVHPVLCPAAMARVRWKRNTSLYKT